jgi:hypothetical protein
VYGLDGWGKYYLWFLVVYLHASLYYCKCIIDSYYCVVMRGKLLALGYESKQILGKKRRNVNYAEDTVTDTGSK